MKKPRLRTVVIYGLVFVGGAVLLNVSQKVQDAEDELRALQGAVSEESESIRVLKAEWSYLNSPARIEALAVDGLGMMPPEPENIVAEPAPSERFPGPHHDIAVTVEEAAEAPSAAPKQAVRPGRKPAIIKQDFEGLLERMQRGGEP